MPYRINSDFYIPSRKSEIIKIIKPHWNGKMSDLQIMEKKQLIGIMRAIRQEMEIQLIKKENYNDNKKQ